MAENKTRPTQASVDDYLTSVSPERAREARALIDIMQHITHEEPVMWGPSIIGFGTQHYKSEAGREGDMGILAFSPRKTALSVYFYEGFDRYGEELSRLGSHKTGQGCLYIKKLADIDLSVLQTMLESSYRIATSKKPAIDSVEEYLAGVPDAAKLYLEELRTLAKQVAPGAAEVMSYGIIGYKPDPKKRAVVFVSGWKDHVAVYPIPKDDNLRRELAPYIHGKGTLWFSLTAPLPRALIQKTMHALVTYLTDTER